MFLFTKKYKQVVTFEDPVIVDTPRFVDASTNTEPEEKYQDYTILFDNCGNSESMLPVFKLYFLDFISKIKKETIIYMVLCFFLKK